MDINHKMIIVSLHTTHRVLITHVSSFLALDASMKNIQFSLSNHGL